MHLLNQGWVRSVIVLLVMVAFVFPADARRKKKRKKKKPAPVAEPAPAPVEPEEPAPPPPPPEPPAPWAVGVNQAQQDIAQRLLGEGNDLFLKSKFKEASEKYEEAIASWDHPAIRFNLVRSLINLGRPVAAYTNLELALKYGRAPLQNDIYSEAITYKKLLLGQIASLEVACDNANTKVSLDGKSMLECPGKQSTMLVPGSHQVVARAPGFLVFTEDIVLLPGKENSVSVRMIAMSEAAITVRRWKRWKPWAVAGAGVAVAGIGGLLQLKAQADYDSYGEEIARSCGDTGCLPADIPGPVTDLEARAGLENKIAIGAFATGGALLVTGVVMLIMNSPKTVMPDDVEVSEEKTALVPIFSPGSAGLGLVTRF